MTTFYMARDQWGNTFHDLGEHPRKGLMARLGYRSATRIYRDLKDGGTRHVGWKVGPHWCDVFAVAPIGARPATTDKGAS